MNHKTGQVQYKKKVNLFEFPGLSWRIRLNLCKVSNILWSGQKADVITPAVKLSYNLSWTNLINAQLLVGHLEYELDKVARERGS